MLNKNQKKIYILVQHSKKNLVFDTAIRYTRVQKKAKFTHLPGTKSLISYCLSVSYQSYSLGTSVLKILDIWNRNNYNYLNYHGKIIIFIVNRIKIIISYDLKVLLVPWFVMAKLLTPYYLYDDSIWWYKSNYLFV